MPIEPGFASARRAFGKLAAWALACVLAGAAAPVKSAGLAPSDFTRALAAAPSCASIQLVGVCSCAGITCGVRVRHHAPVAFIETTAAPWDSLLPGLARTTDLSQGTLSQSMAGRSHTAQAHVWRLGPAQAPSATCQLCSVSSNKLSAAWAALGQRRAGSPCARGSAAGQGAAATAMAGWLSLVYASEQDADNWRSGCLDQPALRAMALPDCGRFPWGGPWECLGSLGPLRPRQMRETGLPQALASLKTAARAMSLAAEGGPEFAHTPGQQSRFQPLYPQGGSCFTVDQRPGGLVTSPDGRYGWLVWQPVECCVTPDAGPLPCLAPAP